MPRTKLPTPDEMHTWEQIDQENAKTETTSACGPDTYVWYKRNGQWLPHRKPTIQELLDNKFK